MVAHVSEESLRDIGLQDARLRLSSVRVLLVDDDIDSLEMVALVLQQQGAIVATATSANEAFDVFTSFRPHVLISDLEMPEQDGFSLMRRIRALAGVDGGAVPSLALTAHVRPPEVALASRAGFTLHLRKPVDWDALTACVANLAAV